MRGNRSERFTCIASYLFSAAFEFTSSSPRVHCAQSRRDAMVRVQWVRVAKIGPTQSKGDPNEEQYFENFNCCGSSCDGLQLSACKRPCNGRAARGTLLEPDAAWGLWRCSGRRIVEHSWAAIRNTVPRTDHDPFRWEGEPFVGRTHGD